MFDMLAVAQQLAGRRRRSANRPKTGAGDSRSLRPARFCQEQTNVSGQAPFWDEDVARDWIRRLGGEPSAENVRRIINLRVTAKWLLRME